MSSKFVNLPANAPFSPEQKVALQALIPSLNSAQSLWLSGFFGALGGLEGAAPSVGSAPPSRVPLTILFGSESGNSEGCAQKLEIAAKAAGFAVTTVDMGDLDPSKLAAVEHCLVVVSTWGEGDPPERATDFHAQVMGPGAPKLDRMRFAVCALGDSSYVDFCKCGRDLDRRFEELGAVRLCDRVDLDVDFEAPFEAWKQKALAAMSAATAAVPAVAVVEPAPVAAPDAQVWSKSNPYLARIKERHLLNGSASKKETIHVEIDLGDSGLGYEPGDVLGAFAPNCPEVIEDFVRSVGFRGDEACEGTDGSSTLAAVLARRDITALTKPFMKKYAAFAKNGELDKLLGDDQKEVLSEWIWGRELRDLFLTYPATDPLSVDQLLSILREQPPRLYSIASSLAAHPGEVHLTIAAVRYHAHGRDRKGVCSTYFVDRAHPGDCFPMYLHRNKNFKLPGDPQTPIIMVGPGTGIAPFRAFVEERAATGATGKNWLFFGDWTFQNDFLYQTEWQKYLNSGTLTRMDVAFSRDQEKKIYVQHRMQERSRDLYAWLEEGAHFYVCGDAKRMARDVHQALIDAVATHGAKSPEEAEAYVKQLQKDKRYQRDVY